MQAKWLDPTSIELAAGPTALQIRSGDHGEGESRRFALGIGEPLYQHGRCRSPSKRVAVLTRPVRKGMPLLYELEGSMRRTWSDPLGMFLI
jgi:hypothetical protein